MITLEELIVIIVRLVGALPVLKWAFAGAIIAILVDLSDLFIIGNLQLGGVRDYQSLDKALDLAYMLTFLVVVLKWEDGWERRIALILFVYRCIGFIVFEFTDARIILFIFPNVFETWFLFIAGKNLIKPKNKLSLKGSILLFPFPLILKLLQEYILHCGKLLDNYKMGDALSVKKDIFKIF